MNSKITLYICKVICWNCKKEFKAAYAKWERSGKQCVVSPENFSEKDKAFAAENGVIIKPLVYPNGDVYTANICPHCNKPYSNNRIDDFVGHEEKEIIMLSQNYCPVYKGEISAYECDEICVCVDNGRLINDGIPPLMEQSKILERKEECINCKQRKNKTYGGKI